jgi:Cdc6-like AAA superfamily ATPase
MKKLILQFIKNHEQKSKLDLISELLILGNVEENIDLFNKVKSQFHLELDLYKHQEEKRISLINRIRPLKQYNTDFDKPLPENCDVKFEIVNSN